MSVGILFILQTFAQQRNISQIQSRRVVGNFIFVNDFAADRNIFGRTTTRNVGKPDVDAAIGDCLFKHGRHRIDATARNGNSNMVACNIADLYCRRDIFANAQYLFHNQTLPACKKRKKANYRKQYYAYRTQQ